MDEDEILPGDDHDEVIRRLRRLGSAPLTEGVASRCLDRLQSGRGPRGRTIPVKVLVAATVGAFVFGGVGLAAADVLPAPVQDVAHTTLDRVGVHVPPGHDRYNDPVACPGGPYRNHGAYVRAHKNDPTAGKSPCGKPVQSLKPSGAKTSDDTKDTKDTNDSKDGQVGHGPPPWAHNKSKQKKDHASKDKKTEPPDDEKSAPAATSPRSTPSSTTTTTETAAPTSTASTSSTTTTSQP